MLMDRYKAKHIIVGHTIFKDISTFYNGKVIGVNVDNKENREKKRGRAMLIEIISILSLVTKVYKDN